MKVLVADDEPKLVEALRIILTGAGYEFCSAADGGAALAVYGMHRPDLVILDVMMPKLDGTEVCASIRAMDPDVPILMLSAKGDILDKREGFGAGADDYLTKPFNEEEVLLRVEALLRRRARGSVASAKGDILDKREGFGAGADDYLTKPFNEEEVLLRVEALLRRRARGSVAAAEAGAPTLMHPVTIGDLTIDPRRCEVVVRGKAVSLTPKEFQIVALMADNPGKPTLMHPVTIGDLTIDPRRCEVVVRGKAVSLTPKEFQIVALMADNPGKVFTREDLIDSIWGSDYRDGSISIPAYVRRIREKIEDDPSNPRYLQTVWRFGYRLGE